MELERGELLELGEPGGPDPGPLHIGLSLEHLRLQQRRQELQGSVAGVGCLGGQGDPALAPTVGSLKRLA